MAKVVKKLFWLGTISAIGYFGFKFYKRVTAVSKLSKSLPEFLNNVYGEKPKVNINMVFNAITVRTGFTQEILDENEDIQSTITEYIEDFYPSLSSLNLNVDVFTVEVSSNETTEECNCNCGEHGDEECDCGDDCKCEESPAEETTETEEEIEVEETEK
jgi:hypothetical protein